MPGAPASSRGGLSVIDKRVLAADAADIDFTGIPGSYDILVLYLLVRGTTVATATSARVQFNGDTSAIYDGEQAQAAANILAAGEVLNAANLLLGNVPAASAPAGTFGAVQVAIPGYASLVAHKAVISDAAHKTADAAGGIVRLFDSGVWPSLDAITRIRVFPTANNWLAGSRATLCGIG